VAFSSSGSFDPDGSIQSYAWSFGDGSTATGSTASHTYTEAGAYAAVLTVTDNRGATNTAQAFITVRAAKWTQRAVSRIRRLVETTDAGPRQTSTSESSGGSTSTR
jgi:PKD repeat protein